MPEPRITVIVTKEFKRDVNIKVARKETTITEVVIKKLTEWLKEK